MKRIGVLSDTHGFWDEKYVKHFDCCDEIWHAGDIGSWELVERFKAFKPFRAVYGNIDGGETRMELCETLHFEVEGLRVMLKHIGGYPGKYDRRALAEIEAHRPNLFVCGHSHILKVMFDAKRSLLCMNPGAAGIYGFQQARTLIRFEIDGGQAKNLEVIELEGKRPL